MRRNPVYRPSGMNGAPVADPAYAEGPGNTMPLDALKLMEVAERLAFRGDRRRYYRFRTDRWYGGVASADVVGCNLRCVFCWSRSRDPNAPGKLLSPEAVAAKLYELAERRRIRQARLTGGEPTIGWHRHTRRVAELIVRDYGLHFILETNGILIGLDRRIARDLADLASEGSLEVRVSIKGAKPETFERITLVDRRYWEAQLEALRVLVEEGLKPGDEVYPAIVMSFDDEEDIRMLIKRIAEIHPALAENIDPEYVILYPHVKQRLAKAGIWPRRFFRPGEPLPEWMI